MNQEEYEEMMEAQQSGGGINTSPYQSPMHNFGSSIILLTSTDNELHKLELTLRSVQEDSEGNPVPLGKPLVNEKGISSIIGIAQAIINRHTIMSNLNDMEVRMLMDFFADTLSRDLMVNRIAYDITDASAREKIYWETLSSAFVTLKRGYKEGDKKFWKGSTQEIRTSNDGGSQKKGLFSFLGNWSK